MKHEFIINERGYDVPCLYRINGREKVVCIVVHGFGSSKESPTAKKMLKELPPLDIGAISFDFPAHGESKVDGEYLRLANCLADLAVVEARTRSLAPEAEIVYFGSSFGAYITLIYLAERDYSGRRAFLRSAAVGMSQFILRLTPEQRKRLEAEGQFTLEAEEYGYIRSLKLMRGFVDDLESHDAFTLWREDMAELMMVHGESDRTVPLREARSFAEKFHVPITVIPEGDHRLSVPGAPEQVLKLAADFFKRPSH